MSNRVYQYPAQNAEIREEMQMKQYKAVSGPKEIYVTKGNTQSAFDSFAALHG